MIMFKERYVWKREGYDGHGEMPNDLDDLHNYLMSIFADFRKDAQIIIDALYSMDYKIVSIDDERSAVGDLTADEIAQLKSLDLEQCRRSCIDLANNIGDILGYARLKLVSSE